MPTLSAARGATHLLPRLHRRIPTPAGSAGKGSNGGNAAGAGVEAVGAGISMGGVFVIVGIIIAVLVLIFCLYEWAKQKQSVETPQGKDDESARPATAQVGATSPSEYRPYESRTAEEGGFTIAPLQAGRLDLGPSPRSPPRSPLRSPLEPAGNDPMVKEPPRVMTYFGAGDRRGAYERIDGQRSPAWPDR
jgi:hypothetical protein